MASMVKTQPCCVCGQQADDPHHIIGHGMGGMGTKAHDLFTIPLCRQHHDELHHDPKLWKPLMAIKSNCYFLF